MLVERKQLINIAVAETMQCASLVPGDPGYIMFVDVSGGGVVCGITHPKLLIKKYEECGDLSKHTLI